MGLVGDGLALEDGQSRKDGGDVVVNYEVRPRLKNPTCRSQPELVIFREDSSLMSPPLHKKKQSIPLHNVTWL